MSLLFDAMEPFVFVEKVREPDGQGGTVTNWREGATFKAAMTFNTSIEARIAQKQGVTSLYTMTYAPGLPIDYHDIVKRISDGKIFRITSDGADKVTPKGAGLKIEQVSAEEWSLV